MSEQKKSLAEAVLRDVFGDRVGAVASYLCQWRKGSLQDVARALADKDGLKDERMAIRCDRAADALAVLIQHNLLTFSRLGPPGGASAASGIAEYALSLDAVVRITRYPRYLLLVKSLLGDSAELLLDELLKSGQESASRLLLRCLLRKKNGGGDNDKAGGMANGSTVSADANVLFKKLKNLVEGKFIVRVPAPDKGSAVPVSQASLAAEDESVAQHREENLFELPDVKLSLVVAQAAKQEKQQQQQDGQGNSAPPPCPSVPGAADKDVFWRLNEGRFLAAARDQVLVAAASRRIDSNAGRLLKVVLEMTDSPWDRQTSQPFYSTDVAVRVSSLPDCPETLKLYRDQYMKILEEDQAGFLRKIGSEGGGAYEVTFSKAFESLAVATIENVVQEKFSSKALRIFRVIRDRVYAEEAQIKTLVMLPDKETKLLTYQLLENNFIHLQELRKSVGASAHSKSFYLFYCDLNRVARMVLEMCYKASHNMLSRQGRESSANRRLLEKQERIESIADNIKRSEEDPQKLDEQLQELQEMLSPQETAQVRFVHMCLDKLRRASAQIDDTVLVLDMYLALCGPAT